MMPIDERINLAVRLGNYMTGNDEGWLAAQHKATAQNAWFIPQFIQQASHNIARQYLQHEGLKNWVAVYRLPDVQPQPKNVGLVLAGNIPLAGFHDVLCVFLSGHRAIVKTSSKDEVLLKHLVAKLIEWEPRTAGQLQFAEMLKGCDAYIATGGNNAGRHFEYYFRKYPNIIRKNRSSVAVLTGTESAMELEKLADDVHLYFGLGCRNVTKLYVPAGYDFVPLLEALKKYDFFINHNKYKNNYDYNLAIHLLNNQYYMTNGSVLLVENKALLSPISQLHYETYNDIADVDSALAEQESLQCVVGRQLPFGAAQHPNLTDYADGIDTMAFLKSI